VVHDFRVFKSFRFDAVDDGEIDAFGGDEQEWHGSRGNKREAGVTRRKHGYLRA
jgi:hypothetical protein